MLITGTRKGIGRELALRYLEAGWRVAGCSRGAGTIDKPEYRHFEVDVADEKAVVSMVRAVWREHGRIDALLNNAGIASMNPALTTPVASMRRMLETNVVGTFLLCREVGKLMVRRGGGRIVNFSSVAVPLALEGEAAYAASKSAVESLTRVLARELGGSGVTVNAIGPTPVDTDLVAGVPAEKLEALVARQAIRRMGTVDDVQAVVDFFLAPSSDFVTGQVVYLGGID
ncbi:MAG: SDR family oxidoreductase [Verrucomicrobia bacterium]|nr:MAG: SDR family oxidoreductase [Verrucomicrobiota bacterium]